MQQKKYDGKIKYTYNCYMISDPLFQAVQAQNNKSHFSQCDGKQDLSAMFPTAAIVKVIIYDYLCRQLYNNIVAIWSKLLLG